MFVILYLVRIYRNLSNLLNFHITPGKMFQLVTHALFNLDIAI